MPQVLDTLRMIGRLRKQVSNDDDERSKE
jgi:hypothetical protein